MNDISSKVKQKVLQEIMDLMDSNMLGDLKGKSPKMMALEVDAKKPDDESMTDKIKSMIDPDHDGDDDSKEMVGHDPMHDPEHDDEDDKERLRELYAKLR